MSTPSTRGQPFILTYTSIGGAELGPKLYERQTSLSIHGADRNVVLEQHRSESDEAGAPIGIFRWAADPESSAHRAEPAWDARECHRPH